MFAARSSGKSSDMPRGLRRVYRHVALFLVFAFGVYVLTKTFFWTPIDTAQPFKLSLAAEALAGGMGVSLVIVGFGGFLGRSPNVLYALLRYSDLNSIRSAIRDALLCGLSGVTGLVLLLVYIHQSLQH